MLILGLDPGLQNTGWGVIRQDGNRLSYVASGTIKSKNTKDSLANRLVDIFEQLTTILKDFDIAEASVEETFVSSNGKTTLKLGQARAVSLLVPALNGVSVFEYGANAIKKSIVGAGHADKHQMMHMIKVLLPQSDCQSDHEADALGAAICHAHNRKAHSYMRDDYKVTSAEITRKA